MIGIVTYSLLLGLLVIGALRKPSIAVAAVLCLYGLKQWGQNSTSILVQHRTFTNIAVGVLVVFAIFLRWSRGNCILCRMTPVMWLVFALYAYALSTTAWTPNIEVALEQWAINAPYLLTILCLGSLLVGSLEDARWAFTWAVIVGGCLCVLALVFGHWGSRGLIVNGDIFESETNALAIASMAGTVLIAALLSLQNSEPLLKRALCLVAVPFAIAVIVRSGSRGQLLSSAAALVIAWPIAYRQKNLGSFILFVGTLAVVAVVGFVAADLLQINTDRWSGERQQEAVAGRWEMGMALLAQLGSSAPSILFGLGNSSSFYYVGYYPHITFLEVIAEEGLIGFAIYMAILMRVVGSSFALVKSSAADARNRAATAILVAVFVFELLLTWKQGSLLSSLYAFLYGVLLDRLRDGSSFADSQALQPEQAAIPRLRFNNLLR